MKISTSLDDLKLHCWQDEAEHIANEEGINSERFAALGEASGTCMLFLDHEGPHVFTPDDDIVVTFK